VGGACFPSAGPQTTHSRQNGRETEASLWKWRSEGGMMERLPQRFCPPSELGNPQRRRVPTFPQRRRLRLSNWTQLLDPRKSIVFTDSRPEPSFQGLSSPTHVPRSRTLGSSWGTLQQFYFYPAIPWRHAGSSVQCVHIFLPSACRLQRSIP
jgi:hypothetical protein